MNLSGSQGIKGEKGDKGDKGDTGAAAGFGTPTATVDGTTGTPSVSVSASGTDTQKVFSFNFSGLKGQKGDTGDKGDTGTAATVQVGTVQTGVAGSQAQVVNAGSTSAAVLNFTIPKGDKGDTGENGKTPSFEINDNGELIATFE